MSQGNVICNAYSKADQGNMSNLMKHLVKHYIYLKVEECTMLRAIKKNAAYPLGYFCFPCSPSLRLSVIRMSQTHSHSQQLAKVMISRKIHITFHNTFIFFHSPPLVPHQSWRPLRPPPSMTRLPMRLKPAPLWPLTPPNLSLTFRSDWLTAADWSRSSTTPTGDWFTLYSSSWQAQRSDSCTNSTFLRVCGNVSWPITETADRHI